MNNVALNQNAALTDCLYSAKSNTSGINANNLLARESTPFSSLLKETKLLNPSTSIAEFKAGQLQELIKIKVQEFVKRWDGINTRYQQRVKILSVDDRAMLDLQTSVNRMNFEMQLAAQCAETLSAGLRRMQQMGAS